MREPQEIEDRDHEQAVERVAAVDVAKASRRGKLKALVAIARTILVIIWHLLADRAARYDDLGDNYYITTINTDRKVRSHIRQLQSLGYTVTVTPAA